MKSIVRLVSLCLLLLSGVSAGIARAQAPDPQFDSTFVNAKKMEDTSPEKAYSEYLDISKANNGKNNELAGDALLRAALLGYTQLTKPAPGPVSDDVRQQQTDFARYKAHEALRQLIDGRDLSDTRAARYAREPHWEDVRKHTPADLKAAMESEIDLRNSKLLSYQLINMLVNMTGANPQFSYWFALILIALFVKAITLPLQLRMYKSQREMQRVQPMLKELQEKYKGKPELNEKLMAFYKEHGVNPFASCFPMFIQLPFLYLVYNTIRMYEYHFSYGKFLWIGSSFSYHFASTGIGKTLSTWVPSPLATDLAKFDVILLVVYCISNYLTMKLTPTPDPSQAQQQKTMSVMMTGMMFFMFITYRWSAAFILYWLIMNFLSAFQTYQYVYKPNKVQKGSAPILPAEKNGARKPEERVSGNGALSTARPVSSSAEGTRPRPKPRNRNPKR